MYGDDLLKEFQRRIMAEKGTSSVSDSVLAAHLGLTQPALANYRGKDLTPRQVANLCDKFSKARQDELIDSSVRPIAEFFKISLSDSKQGASWQLFSTLDENGAEHSYRVGLKARLEDRHGIYVFHDSRGQAIYAGKAHKLSLWKEMNNALNRDRGEVQNIKRVAHPISRVAYKGPEEKNRKIVKTDVALHYIANYFSAYEIPEMFIGKFEALIVRAFANDLLNVRMENF